MFVFVFIFLMIGYVEKMFDLEVEDYLYILVNEIIKSIINREIVLNKKVVWMFVF